MRNHVCVLQTVMVCSVQATTSMSCVMRWARVNAESKETAIRRMEQNGAEVVTTEMVLFEWLQTADDPRLRKVIDLIR